MTDFYKKNDNLLRDKLTQHEFVQSSSAWENMSALLDQHPVVAKRAIGYWWSIPFVTASALAGVIGLGMYFTPTPVQNAEINLPIAGQTAKESILVETPAISKQLEVNRTISKQEGTSPLVEKEPNLMATKVLPSKEVSAKKTSVVKKTVINKTKSNSPAVLAVAESNAGADKQIKEKTAITALPNLAKESSVQGSKRKVKTTRTEIIYQYSTTPLRALQEKRKAMQQQNTIGTFGIGDELNIKKSPLKASVFGGVSAKVYNSTKDFSVMPFAGVSASYRLAKHHGIQTGLQYKSMGSQSSNAQLSTSGDLEQTIKRIDLLEVPLVYQFHPHPKYNIQAGVKGAWVMNTETSNPNMNNLSNAEMGISDFDFSLLLGVEYCFNEHWAMGVQYSLGLVNLTKEATNMHEEEIQAARDAGSDPVYNINSLEDRGELIVPVGSQNQSIKVPNQLRNTDVQLLLKYTF